MYYQVFDRLISMLSMHHYINKWHAVINNSESLMWREHLIEIYLANCVSARDFIRQSRLFYVVTRMWYGWNVFFIHSVYSYDGYILELNIGSEMRGFWIVDVNIKGFAFCITLWLQRNYLYAESLILIFFFNYLIKIKNDQK